MAKIRVLVVEDSITVRRRICEVLGTDRDIEVVAEAADGKRAIELCRDLRPDVVTLDMLLPIMNGLSATEYIMAHFPTPILIVSSSTNRGDLYKTYDALRAGAVEVLDKPRGDESDEAWERRLIDTVKLVSRIKVITHLRARLGPARKLSVPPAASPPLPSSPPAKRPVSVVAIGASTGGPGAIVEVLTAISAPLSVPVLIVLHIDEPFATSFAEWLNDQTPHAVSYAPDGGSLAALGGRVLLAPPGRHLTVQHGRVVLTLDPPRHFCRPSVDVLFESLASECGRATVACLLTGMGRDGASGLLEIRRAGGLTIAQDEASSVIYGMPREAALLGAAERVLPLGEIGAAMMAAVGPRDGRSGR